MPIPESQLDTWSHQGSVQQSSATYQTIKTALEDTKAGYCDKEFEVFLQGSYGNDTNIYAESDVDVVIRLDSIWRSDLNNLPADQQVAYHRSYPNATYTFDEFKSGVATRLSNAFGASNITQGNKAFKIKPNGSRRSADVVPCYQYRRYRRFISTSDQLYIPGVIFPTGSTGEIINYPKLHSENCTARHQEAGQWLKPMVRIVKNIRTKLVDDGVISKDTALSYYLECMLCNAPNENFGNSYQDTFYKCFTWLLQTDRSKLRCAHNQFPLLGNSNVQWSPNNCDQFLDAVVKLWKGW